MKAEYKTKPRNAIIEYLKEHADTRFTARDILNAINSGGEELDRSTIYRNLERLCKEGELVKYKERDINAACYQYSENHGSCHKHMHARCMQCGKVIHLENEILREASQKIQSEYGFDIDYGKTVIVGTCNKCREK